MIKKYGFTTDFGKTRRKLQEYLYRIADYETDKMHKIRWFGSYNLTCTANFETLGGQNTCAFLQNVPIRLFILRSYFAII